ncbi:MAG: peptide-methionine (S)-S-oxide reductase MsrA [Pseudomonadota bacterium]
MKHSALLAAFAALCLSSTALLSACAEAPSRVQSEGETTEPRAEPKTMVASAVSGPLAPYMPDAPEGLATAIFAGGCFWCVEKDFEALDGVVDVTSGYTGGTLDDPDYKTVSYTETGHYEAAEVLYDPSVVSYRELVDFYWTTVDPTDPDGQFCDKGSSYRTAVFATPEQRADADASLDRLLETKPFDEDIVTPVLDAVTFYDAEDYHQDYYKKNPIRYRAYRAGCRRDARLKRLWGDAAHGGK